MAKNEVSKLVVCEENGLKIEVRTLDGEFWKVGVYKDKRIIRLCKVRLNENDQAAVKEDAARRFVG